MDDPRTSTAILTPARSSHTASVEDPLARSRQDNDLDLRILVSLATYNERDNLASLIHEIHAVVSRAEILVIDDNSPDGTGKLADELASALYAAAPGKPGG